MLMWLSFINTLCRLLATNLACCSLLHVESVCALTQTLTDVCVHTAPMDDSMAVFVCKVHPPTTDVHWFVDGIDVFASDKYRLLCNVADGSRQLAIHHVTYADEGEVSINAGGVTSTAYLTVTGGCSTVLQLLNSYDKFYTHSSCRTLKIS